jgi:double-stranded uracil-DNA glycosylase
MMSALLEFNPALPYAERVAALEAAGISVWDVLQSCTRQGSLDAAIDKSSIVTNDFKSFFVRQPAITHVFFNGSAAEQLFGKAVLPVLETHPLQYRRLPSTSPANASIAFEAKLEAWRAVLLKFP